MRLVTWNINSVRARLKIVERLINEIKPDILCLQETKVQDHEFPHAFFAEMGMPHLAIKGQKSHHGVAIASRLPIEDSFSIDWCGMGDARHIAVKAEGVPTVHNFYVPAGGDEPDPEVNEKFAHKMKFLEEMTAWSKGLTDPSILVGDLNIAPEEHDVWSSKALRKVVSHTDVERKAMKKLMDANGWVDVMRKFVPLEEKLFSWWSYRARDWSASDKGRRLDHVWVSSNLWKTPQNMRVARNVRGWEKPSDHAPVVVDFEF